MSEDVRLAGQGEQNADETRASVQATKRKSLATEQLRAARKERAKLWNCA